MREPSMTPSKRLVASLFLSLASAAGCVDAPTSRPPPDAAVHPPDVAAGDAADAPPPTPRERFTVEKVSYDDRDLEPGRVFDTGLRGRSAETVSVVYQFPQETPGGATATVSVEGLAFVHDDRVYAIAPLIGFAARDGVPRPLPVRATVRAGTETVREVAFRMRRGSGEGVAFLLPELERARDFTRRLGDTPEALRARDALQRLIDALQVARRVPLRLGVVETAAGPVEVVVRPEDVDAVGNYIMQVKASMPGGLNAQVACIHSGSDTALCMGLAATISGVAPAVALGIAGTVTLVAIGGAVVSFMEAEAVAAALGRLPERETTATSRRNFSALASQLVRASRDRVQELADTLRTRVEDLNLPAVGDLTGEAVTRAAGALRDMICQVGNCGGSPSCGQAGAACCGEGGSCGAGLRCTTLFSRCAPEPSGGTDAATEPPTEPPMEPPMDAATDADAGRSDAGRDATMDAARDAGGDASPPGCTPEPPLSVCPRMVCPGSVTTDAGAAAPLAGECGGSTDCDCPVGSTCVAGYRDRRPDAGIRSFRACCVYSDASRAAVGVVSGRCDAVRCPTGYGRIEQTVYQFNRMSQVLVLCLCFDSGDRNFTSDGRPLRSICALPLVP